VAGTILTVAIVVMAVMEEGMVVAEIKTLF
jgi:hypothetical protein